MKRHLILPLFLLPLGTAGAQEHALRTNSASMLPALTEVLVDQPGDARIWARGGNYKASFGTEGARFVPFFGSQAPRNFPLHFTLASIEAGDTALLIDSSAPAELDALRITYARGPVLERYDLALEQVEQSFVIDTSGLSGNLILRLVVDTELQGQFDEQGIVFSNEHGSVSYSQAFVVEDSGDRLPLQTTLDGSTIEIQVPADAVEASNGKLVIDPIINISSLPTQGFELLNPDTASGVESERCYVVESIYSQTDHDVLGYRLSENDIVISSVSIEFTDMDWRMPKVAYNRNSQRWLAVAQAQPTAGKYEIYGRQFTMGAQVMLFPQFSLTPSAGNHYNPTLGGDLNPEAGTQYAMVCEYVCDTCPTTCTMKGVFVSGTGSIVGPGFTWCPNLPSGSRYVRPALSKTNGIAPIASRYWGLAYELSSGLLFSDTDLYFRRIPYGGPGGESPLTIDGGSGYTTNASVSSPAGSGADSGRVLVSYTYTPTFAGNATIRGALVKIGDPASTLTMQVLDTQDLIDLVGATTANQQGSSTTDSDGADFVVAWSETNTSTSSNFIGISTVTTIGDKLAPAGGTSSAYFGTNERPTGVSALAKYSASGAPIPSRMYSVAAEADDANSVGIAEALLYAPGYFTYFCSPGTGATLPCPCGNAPSSQSRGCDNSSNTGGGSLSGSGSLELDSISLSASFLRPNATAIFLQGDVAVPAGVTFGDGIRCAGGQLLRLAVRTTSSGGQSTYPVAGEDSIRIRSNSLGAPISAGAKRVYQVYYRDPLSSGCAATFNITSAVQVQW